jgi:hypothetical protein
MGAMTKATKVELAVLTVAGLLAILFVALKMNGVLDWAWFWVLSPLWGLFLFAVLLIVVTILTVWLWDPWH